MERFNRETVSVPDAVFERARAVFDSHAVDDARTIDVIRQVYESTGYLLDPHSAIGLEAGRQCHRNSSTPMVTLATAHPAKFPQAVMQAGQSEEPGLPHYMSDLYQRPERYSVLDGDLATVQGFIADNISGSA